TVRRIQRRATDRSYMIACDRNHAVQSLERMFGAKVCRCRGHSLGPRGNRLLSRALNRSWLPVRHVDASASAPSPGPGSRIELVLSTIRRRSPGVFPGVLCSDRFPGEGVRRDRAATGRARRRIPRLRVPRGGALAAARAASGFRQRPGYRPSGPRRPRPAPGGPHRGHRGAGQRLGCRARAAEHRPTGAGLVPGTGERGRALPGHRTRRLPRPARAGHRGHRGADPGPLGGAVDRRDRRVRSRCGRARGDDHRLGWGRRAGAGRAHGAGADPPASPAGADDHQHPLVPCGFAVDLLRRRGVLRTALGADPNASGLGPRDGRLLRAHPTWTPPLDTAEGHTRPVVQLVGITDTGAGYTFDFSRLDRWLGICRDLGMRSLEIAHLCTQWGARFTPAIQVRTTEGVEDRFGWHVPATSPAYRRLLEALIPALREHLDHAWEGEVLWHISDEPREDQLEPYQAAKEQVADLLEGARVVYALSS